MRRKSGDKMFKWLFDKNQSNAQKSDQVKNQSAAEAPVQPAVETAPTEAPPSAHTPAQEEAPVQPTVETAPTEAPPTAHTPAQEEAPVQPTVETAPAEAPPTADSPAQEEAPIQPTVETAPAEAPPSADSSAPDSAPETPDLSSAPASPTLANTTPARTTMGQQNNNTPAIGSMAVASDPPRFKEVKITDIQANGRRVIVDLGIGTRAYSLRKDGSYRLEGAPDTSQSKLVFDKTVEELKPIKSVSAAPMAASYSSGAPGFVAAPTAVETTSVESVETSVAPVEASTVSSDEKQPTLSTAVTAESSSILASKLSAAPKIGASAVVAHHPRYDEVKIVDIQAGGRRLIVKIGNGMRAYSRRKDNSYRLEGAPDISPARLIIDKSVDEIKSTSRLGTSSKT